jgi:hypothetical protein
MPLALELEVSEEKLIEAFYRLPSQQRVALLEKLQVMCQPELRCVPADRLKSLTGLVLLGGDARTDAEALYDDIGSD